METQAHHLHHAPGKKFWHYVFEFIMLFLAVFCGFVAENVREHQMEDAKGKMYVVSMIEDLETDTANLNMVLKQYDTLNLKTDTLIKNYDKLALGFNDTVFRCLGSVLGFPDFIYINRTMQQLKNAGGMQLIKNKAATDGILDYDAKVDDLDIDVSTLNDLFNQVLSMYYQIIDLEALEKDINSKSLTEIRKMNKNYLLVSDKATLGKWNNIIRNFKGNELMVESKERELKQKAIDLIKLLKKEYELD